MKILHYFNPGHENTVLNRLPSYTLPASLINIMKDLSCIPLWYANLDDLVFVPNDFPFDFWGKYQELGFILPKVVKESKLSKYDNLKVSMWGISPQSIRVFEGLNKKYTLNIKLPEWDESYIHYTSRRYAKDVLEELIDSSDAFSSLSLPLFLADMQSVEDEVKQRRAKILVKSPYSSSGRGLLWISEMGIERAERQLLQGMLKRQGVVSIEPVYDKVLDFAMEFMSNRASNDFDTKSNGRGNVNFVGYSLFTTNKKGVYLGNTLLPQDDIAQKITEYIDPVILLSIQEKLKYLLSEIDYSGCIGVDMMVYVDDTGATRLHPCVEVNLRYNMGYLAAMLFEKHLCAEAKGIFNIVFDAATNIHAKHSSMLADYPLKMNGNRMESGYLPLCPVGEDTKYLAYILVEE